ncbi:MAG TPA: tetratricopeptide repeat protein, partial [Burkholderiaceae bacterium]|nr:tetratricopeptide repeat protein [Burkholderiaceae bacterium]
SIKPDFAEALDYLGFLLRERGELQKSIDCYRKALAINPLSRDTHSSMLFALQFDEKLTQEDLHAEHLRFAESFEKPLASSRQIHANEKSTARRLKIGYVSPDFCRHSVALFMLPVLLNHDKERFEVFCYYNNATGDDFTDQFVSAADQFVPCAEMSDDELCERIRADGIDILIDLAGHTAHNRLLTFARKPAPVQMTYLGYPGTSGLSAIDYRLTDSFTNPEGSDRYYTEQLLRLPDSMWCYRPAENMQEVIPLPALGNGYLTFGSFNSINKVGNDCIALWADLLRTLPTSRLLMATVPEGEIRQRLSRQFLEYGISSDRIRFIGTLPKYEFQQMLQQADISLDPFPVNGATTTCESLWLGVPVLTLVGNRFLSRAGLSVLSAARLPEFAAATREAYLNTAAALASDLPRLANIRSTMRDHLMASPLLDVKRFTRNLEDIYRNAWITWCNTGE